MSFFRRNRNPSGERAATEASQATGPAFRLGTDIYDLVTDSRSGWQVLSDPRRSHIELFRPNGGSIRVELSSVPHNRWLQVFDATQHQPTPLQVRVSGQSGREGRWIEITLPTPSESPDPLTPEEREELTYKAFSDLTEDHYRTMDWIRGI